MGNDAKYWLLNIVLSLTVSFAAIFCIPNIVNWSIGAETGNNILPVVGLLVAMIISFLMLLVIKRNRSNGKLLLTVLATVIAIVLMAVVLSMLCGIVAWLMYFLLKNLLNFGQIKGVIDFLTTTVVMLSMPLMVSVFWKEMWMEEGIGKAFLSGFSMNGKQYIRLLALICILFGIGLLISTAFHYAATDVLTHIMKVLLFTAMGTGGMAVSEKIVMEGGR